MNMVHCQVHVYYHACPATPKAQMSHQRMQTAGTSFCICTMCTNTTACATIVNGVCAAWAASDQ